ncbi:MCM2/3/5 family protein (macronuclear) [Tetrahymena thermophila SB210]|uniref:MCM2/3/5 family protein n=1 Tax=Tetrahymena thermophila (strain SB210) TaxID=312017 RepID=Q22RW4_TETTS|nr:MCM2/3/5 family protein [Tetrahymena thermophila SB210]EAR88008.3 MCM2/3/5 family protein [Tetrahymena thermophila SB210]|eukprot:XP_001008253.3 MCM2/3/5 family protein [Tetrahymena thermophila SB210]
MINKRTSFTSKMLSGRKNSCQSTTSSAESHNFRSTNDIDHKVHLIEKSPNKYKLITENKQTQNKSQLRRLNNLKLLGFIKVKECGGADLKNEQEQQLQFKKTFKVNQKGLIFDNHQYFLNLNAVISNNHLIRQSSPVERLKANLYDEERVPQISQYIKTNSTNFQDTPLSQTNQYNLISCSNGSNNNKKKAAFRRRSCYCNQTGKQSQKAQKIDFQLPTTFIKNRIYQRMKRKQEMKMNLNEKDLIIQNLNRTFDIQEKNSARGSLLNSPNIMNMQQTFNFLDTPMSGRVMNTPSASNRYNNQHHVHSSQAQRSQFSYMTSPKNGQQHSNQGTATHSKKDDNTLKNAQSPVNRNPNSKPTFAETIEYIKEEQSQQQNVTPQSKQEKKSPQKTNSQISSKELELSLNKVVHRKNISSNKNSPKNNHVSASPNRQTPVSSSKKSSMFNYFGVGGKTLKDDSHQKQQYESIYPEQVEKRKKWITKLRIATKLVGFQEKQRKKSMLYQQDYYKALEEVANNEVELENLEQNDEFNHNNQEKKNILIRKVKQSNINKNNFMLNQIVKQHNLKFNSTIGSFLDMRTKSQNCLLPSTNSSIFAFPQKLSRRHLVSPFNYDSKSEYIIHKKDSKIGAYLQPFPVILSPSPSKQDHSKKSQSKTNQLFQSSFVTNTDKKNKKSNEIINRSSSHKKINSSTMTELGKGNQNKNHFSKNYLLMPKSAKSGQIQLSNSSNSIEELNATENNLQNEASKSSLGLKSNNDKDSHQNSQQNIVSLEQLGRYETYFAKKPDQKNQKVNNQSKTQQKFQLLINNQSIQNSYLIKSNLKNSNSINHLSKTINFGQINQKTASQPDLLQSTFKHDTSNVSSNNLTIKSPNIQNRRPSYLQQKFESKTHRKSILQSYLV